MKSSGPSAYAVPTEIASWPSDEFQIRPPLQFAERWRHRSGKLRLQFTHCNGAEEASVLLFHDQDLGPFGANFDNDAHVVTLHQKPPFAQKLDIHSRRELPPDTKFRGPSP